MENRKFNISVSIEGIQLPLTVSSAEEEKIYRNAASNIQGRVQKLRNMYPNLKNDKYYYVMAMLNTAVESVRTTNRNATQPFFDMMEGLEAEIDDCIKKK